MGRGEWEYDLLAQKRVCLNCGYLESFLCIEEKVIQDINVARCNRCGLEWMPDKTKGEKDESKTDV